MDAIKHDDKLKILNKIVLNASVDNLGDFFQEINLLITQTGLMIDNEQNNMYYNCCTASTLR